MAMVHGSVGMERILRRRTGMLWLLSTQASSFIKMHPRMASLQGNATVGSDSPAVVRTGFGQDPCGQAGPAERPPVGALVDGDAGVPRVHRRLKCFLVQHRVTGQHVHLCTVSHSSFGPMTRWTARSRADKERTVPFGRRRYRVHTRLSGVIPASAVFLVRSSAPDITLISSSVRFPPCTTHAGVSSGCQTARGG